MFFQAQDVGKHEMFFRKTDFSGATVETASFTFENRRFSFAVKKNHFSFAVKKSTFQLFYLGRRARE